MLADLPNEIHVRVDRPRDLAPRLCEVESVESVRVDERRNEVVVSTRPPLVLSRRVPAILSEGGFEVLEVTSGDDSLQQLFTTLMRIHRGEI